MDVHLVDGTYELFRHYYAMPSAVDAGGQEVAAVRGVVASLLGMVTGGATHVAVATDHVIESFRNRLWRGYKTSAVIDRALLSQFPLLEEAVQLLDAGYGVGRRERYGVRKHDQRRDPSERSVRLREVARGQSAEEDGDDQDPRELPDPEPGTQRLRVEIRAA